MADNVVRCDVEFCAFPSVNGPFFGGAFIRCRCNPSGLLAITGGQGHGQSTNAASQVLALNHGLLLARFMRCANIRVRGTPLLDTLINLREPRPPEDDDTGHRHLGFMLYLDCVAMELLDLFESVVFEPILALGAIAAAERAFALNLGEGNQANSLYIAPNE